jgi:hypothetical protein
MPRTRIPIAGGYDKDVAVNVGSARTINGYVEMASATAKVPYYLVGTPGTVLHATLPQGPVRGLWTYKGVMYAVGGNKLYKVTTAGTVTAIGTLSTSIGRVGISDNSVDQIIVVDGPSGYVYNAATEVFAKITDTDFPGATHVDFLDGYSIFCGNAAGRFGISAINDSKSFDALDYATAESDPDDTVALAVDHREVWLFGSNSAEPWQNTGAADYPFERIGGGTSNMGIAARYSLTRMNGSLYWLGQNKEGFQGVCRMDGYNPVIVSSDQVTAEIAGYGTKSDAFGFAYKSGLRTFYVLTFPTEGRTWVYDASIPNPELAWHEWRWDGLTRHRANCHAFLGGAHYVGDFDNGNIYRLDSSVHTDNGDPIRFERIRGYSSPDGRQLFVREVEAVFDAGQGTATGQGADPQAMLQISRDGGRTYGAELWRSMGRMGEYTRRSRWLRLGRGRDMAVKIAITDPVPRRLVDAYAEVEVGTQ